MRLLRAGLLKRLVSISSAAEFVSCVGDNPASANASSNSNNNGSATDMTDPL